MVSIAVTGASGAVGKRVVGLLAERDGVERVVAIDRRRPASINVRSDDRPELDQKGHQEHRGEQEMHQLQLDLMTAELAPALEGCDSVVHLAEDPARRSDPAAATAALDRVLHAATAANCGHVVLLSSALVYGAYADNPVPLTETHAVNPIPALAHAVIKAGLESHVSNWAADTGGRVAVLRPTATLSEGDSSWIGAALRAATAVRSEQVDPPVQFLHHDDLAAALVIMAEGRHNEVFNVAPDGWIGAELFRALRGEAAVRLPQQLSEWRLKAAKSLANRSLLDGLEPYVSFPWVVANDKLRSVGWEPTFSNEEAFVAGTPPPLLASINPQRRQELALGVAGTAGAAVLGTMLWLLRKTVR